MKIKFALSLSLLFILFEAKTAYADVIPQNKIIVKPNVIVSATIGIPKMTIWGHGPTESGIELSGVGVDQKTTSDGTGYYSFDLVYLPNSSTFPELCITAIDQEGRVTPPTCIPPVEAGDYFYNVGPVILPPTISLGAPEVHSTTQVSAQGETIPGSTIEVKLARPDIKEGFMGFELVSSVLAYYVPSYTVLADAKGNYSFNMPTNAGNTWRVFAVAEYEDGNKSPKSNTLKFETLTTTSYIWKSILAFLAAFLIWPKVLILVLLVIILLIIIICIVINSRSKKHQKNSKQFKRYQEYLRALKH